MKAHWWSVVMISLALAVGLVTRLRPPPTMPAKRDPAHAEAWMADSLPGIGTKRLATSLEAIHHERFNDED